MQVDVSSTRVLSVKIFGGRGASFSRPSIVVLYSDAPIWCATLATFDFGSETTSLRLLFPDSRKILAVPAVPEVDDTGSSVASCSTSLLAVAD